MRNHGSHTTPLPVPNLPAVAVLVWDSEEPEVGSTLTGER